MQFYTILQEFPQQEHFSLPHGKQQSYTPLRIPLATMGSEVNPRSHLMSSQLMLASIASATYTASPLFSPKSFPEENARSLLEKFFNLKWQETEENNLRKINCSHESAPNTSVQCTCVKYSLCYMAGLKKRPLQVCLVTVLSKPKTFGWQSISWHCCKFLWPKATALVLFKEIKSII